MIDVCIIDDDPIFVRLLSIILSGTDRVDEITVYKNGKEAFETLSVIEKQGDRLPQIIFLDLNMPIWNGWLFLEECRKKEKSFADWLFVLTSSVNPQDINRAEEYEKVEAFVTKPLKRKELEQILNKCVA